MSSTNTFKTNTPIVTTSNTCNISYPLIIFFDPWRLARLYFITLPDLVVQKFHLKPKEWANFFKYDKRNLWPTTNTLLVAASIEVSESTRRHTSSQLRSLSSELHNKASFEAILGIILEKWNCIKYYENTWKCFSKKKKDLNGQKRGKN